MAKAIITYCDVCLDESKSYVEGSTVSITLAPMKLRTLDLCDVHRKELVTPIEDVLQRFGLTEKAAAARGPLDKQQPPPSSTTAVEPAALDYGCTIDGCDRVFATSQAMKMHVFRTHGIKHSDQVRVES